MTVKHSGRVLVVVALMLTAVFALALGGTAMAAPGASAVAPAAFEIAVSQEVTDTAAMTEEVASGPMDIIDTAVQAGSFTTLASALGEKGLVEALKGVGPYTVFAPTDAAFQAMTLKDRITLYKGATTLKDTLLYHVVAGKIMSSDIVDGMTAETLQGGELTFAVKDGAVSVNGIPISKADIEAVNGVIHVIDGVLRPESSEDASMTDTAAMADTEAMTDTAAMADTEAMTDTAAMADTEAMTDTAAMADTEAMTDTAAMADTEAMTDTAAMADTEAMTDTAAMADTEAMTDTEAMADTEAMTDTAAMADTEAMTDSSAPATLPTTGAARQDAGSIVDIALSDPNFSTLVAAVTAADLGTALSGEGPFTVFAPTNEAFAKIPAETFNALLADPSGDLTQILLYHVVPGTVMAADITDGMEATTLQGGNVKFSIVDGVVMVNDAIVTTADIVASNGVIHVIDTVLMPQAPEAAAEPVVEAAPMAETAPMTETTEMTEAAAMTETAEMTEAAPMAEAAVMTETAEMTEAAPMVEAAVMTETAEMTEAAPMAEAAVMTETAEMTEAPAAEVMAEPVADAAPETLPVTGGSTMPNLSIVVAGLALIALAAAAFFTRRTA